jgi:hypothetical protein
MHINAKGENSKMETQQTYAAREIEMKDYKSFSRSPPRPKKAYARRDRYSAEHRGFNTSITDMYRYPDQERVDCCSIACFGCIQADRNRFFVNGTKPPGLCRRVCVHVMLPLCLFGIALFVAFHVPDPFTNNVMCWAWLIVLLFYFAAQCEKGSWKRSQVRRNLLWAKFKKLTSDRSRHKYHQDSEDTSDNDEDDEQYLMGQTTSDIRNASACCGLYNVDRHSGFEHEGEEGITCLTRAINCFASMCCGICGKYIVCCGFCSVAQEAREIETLVRPGVLRIDYITMQPMMEYYPKIYQARNTDDRPNNWWWNRLSKFSWQTLKNGVIALVLLLIWSLLSKGLNHKFGPKNYIVLILTLLQSFLLLTVVYWKYRNDVSLDALIKFFASGFCLSTTLAIFFELALGLMVRLTMAVIMTVSGIEAVEENGYTHSESVSENPVSGKLRNVMQDVSYGGGNYRDYLTVYGNDHPVVYTMYLFVVSFILAAFIEETCKYFGYRMVDHPDFYSKAEVDEALDCHDNDEEERSTISFSNQNRSLQSRRAAITVSMVAVGVGFACCENLVYVFIYGKAHYTSQILMLLARSFCPVHPIAAALQSIQVCKRDLENQKLQLRSVLFPGVLFHGMFDFMLIWFDYIGSRRGSYVDEDDNIETESGSDKISSIISVMILVAGALYYFRAGQHQRERLASLDARSVPPVDFDLM